MGRITLKGRREEARLQGLIDEIDKKLRLKLDLKEVERLMSEKSCITIKLRNVRKRMQIVSRYYN